MFVSYKYKKIGASGESRKYKALVPLRNVRLTTAQVRAIRKVAGKNSGIYIILPNGRVRAAQ